jgi:plastocyanin
MNHQMPSSKSRWGLAASLLVMLVGGAEAQTTHVVTVSSFTFTPSSLTIAPGDIVQWTNSGGFHNVSADDSSFRCANGCDQTGGDGDASGAAWTASFAFNTTGTFPYHCEIHGASGGVGMSGSITVTSLPVELVTFVALADGPEVVLTWQTASETSNAGFQIEHRNGGHHAHEPFRVLDFVAGQGTTTEAHTYQHRLQGLPAGAHTFRLKQVDLDGTFTYSPIVEVQIEVPGTYVLTSAYPNPFNPQTQLYLTLQREQQVAVRVVDLSGRQVAVLYSGVLAANQAHPLTFDGGSLPSGLYLIRVVGETFAAQRGVLLVK